MTLTQSVARQVKIMKGNPPTIAMTGLKYFIFRLKYYCAYGGDLLLAGGMGS